MNSVRFPAVFLAITLPIFGAGCADTIKMVDVPTQRMTVREAQAAFVESIGHVQYFTPAGDVKFTLQTVRFKLQKDGDKRTSDFIVKFADLGRLSVRTSANGLLNTYREWFIVESDGKPVMRDQTQGERFSFEKEQDAKTLAHALLTLKEAATAPDTEEADFAAFNEAAKTWLAAEPKPVMSDEARTAKALAEDAFKRKEFAAAFDAYVDALRMHPMWPDGHFNAALLAAEVEDYRAAAAHMRRYLLLAPEAKDASAAKDKYLLWKAKSKS